MMNLQAAMFNDASRPGPPQPMTYAAQATPAAGPWQPTQPQQSATAPLGAEWQQPYGQAAAAASVEPAGPPEFGRDPALLRRHLPEVSADQLNRLIGPAPAQNQWS